MNRLGNLPLAVEQAIAYIGTTSIQLKQYLELYDRNAKALLEPKPPFSNYRHETVLTTWEISFTAIQESHPKAAKILLYSGFLAKNDLFAELFQWGFQAQGQNNQDWENEIRKAIQKLRSFSLIRQWNPMDTFSIHPMIHLWIQERPFTPRENLAKETAHLLDRVWRMDKQHRFADKLVPHLDAVFKGFRDYHCAKPGINEPMLMIPPLTSSYPSTSIDYIDGWYLRLRARVESLWYTILGALQGNDLARPLWHTMYRLGRIYRHGGHHKSHEALYRCTLATAWRSLPKKHPAALAIAGDLAFSIFLRGGLEESLMWYQWTLAARQHVLGPSDPATMGALKGIAHIYDDSGQHEKALELFIEVFDRRLKRLGKCDWLTLFAVDAIASSLEREGSPEAVEWRLRYHNWASERDDDDPKEASDRILSIGRSLRRNCRKEEAKTWLISSLHQLELSGNHGLNDILGEIICLCDTTEESLRWHRKLLQHIKATSDDDVDYSSSYRALALALRNAEHLEEALHWCFQALRIEEDLWGVNGESLFTILWVHRMIADNFQDLERHNEALEWYVRAIHWLEGDPDYRTKRDHLWALKGRLRSLIRLGRLGEAEAVWYDLRVWSLFIGGEESKNALELVIEIYTLLHELGYYDNELETLRQLLEWQIALHGDDSLGAMMILGQIGRIHHDQGDFHEAYHLLIAALDGKRRILSEEDDEVIASLYDIALTSWDMGHYHDAFGWYFRALKANQCKPDVNPALWITRFEQEEMMEQAEKIRNICKPARLDPQLGATNVNSIIQSTVRTVRKTHLYARPFG